MNVLETTNLLEVPKPIGPVRSTSVGELQQVKGETEEELEHNATRPNQRSLQCIPCVFRHRGKTFEFSGLF